MPTLTDQVADVIERAARGKAFEFEPGPISITAGPASYFISKVRVNCGIEFFSPNGDGRKVEDIPSSEVKDVVLKRLYDELLLRLKPRGI